VPGLAKELQIPQSTVHSWIKRSWVHAEQEANRFKRWIVWFGRGRISASAPPPRLPAAEQPHHPFPVELTTPKAAAQTTQ